MCGVSESTRHFGIGTEKFIEHQKHDLQRAVIDPPLTVSSLSPVYKNTRCFATFAVVLQMQRREILKAH
jgi:hypothetical protein